MAIKIDRTGQRFGLLIVEGFAYRDEKGYNCWKCRCDCGNTCIVRGGNLQSGNTTSCGCVGAANRKRLETMFSERYTTHGHGGTRLSKIWYNLKGRCNNPNDKYYYRYGERGIKVCKEWDGPNGFAAFYDWAMTHGYGDSLSIDRIDLDGDYCPENCKWSTAREQANNRSTNRMVTVNGETMTFAECCRKYNMKYSKVRDRVASGWSIEEAVEIVPHVRGIKRKEP